MVNVNVSVGDTMVAAPAAFQGMVVPATGLVVLDLHRWVFEASSLAVTATAVSGVIVVGALELTSETVKVASRSASGSEVRDVFVTGSSLLVGPDHGRGRWSFTAMQSSKGVASTYSVYNPGSKAVEVSVAPPGTRRHGGRAQRGGSRRGHRRFRDARDRKEQLRHGLGRYLGANGTPIVAARLTTRYETRLLEAVDVTAGTAGPARGVAGAGWVARACGSRTSSRWTTPGPQTPRAGRLFELGNGQAGGTRPSGS